MSRRLVATIVFALMFLLLASQLPKDAKATSSSLLMARFWGNQNYNNLIWEHYYEYICPTSPSFIGNIDLSMAGIDNRIESVAAYGYEGFCNGAHVYQNSNFGGTHYNCAYAACATLGSLNNQVSSYKLYK